MALNPVAKFVADLRKKNPQMTDDEISAAVQAQASAALEALKHAIPRPTGASAKPEIPLAK